MGASVRLLFAACSRLGVRANTFNVGSLRRKVAVGTQNFDFFDDQNVAAKLQREELAYNALDMALEWLGWCAWYGRCVSWTQSDNCYAGVL